MEVFKDCLKEIQNFGNPHFQRNFFGQLSPSVHIDYQGQPWSKGIPYVVPVSSTKCKTIAYIKQDVCDLVE